MFIIKEGYGNIFRPEVKEKFVKASLSTGRKNRDGSYINSSWNCIFVGKCLDDAKELTGGERIKITSANVTNEPNDKYKDDNGKARYFLSVTIFDFEVLESSKGKTKKAATKSKPKVEDYDEEDDPL